MCCEIYCKRTIFGWPQIRPCIHKLKWVFINYKSNLKKKFRYMRFFLQNKSFFFIKIQNELKLRIFLTFDSDPVKKDWIPSRLGIWNVQTKNSPKTTLDWLIPQGCSMQSIWPGDWGVDVSVGPRLHHNVVSLSHACNNNKINSQYISKFVPCQQQQ